MLKSQEAFASWLRNHFGRAITIWHEQLDQGPLYYLQHPQHRALDTFYVRYGHWEEWVLELDAQVRMRVGQPETWLAFLGRRFDLDRPLRMTIWREHDPRVMRQVDFSNREIYAERSTECEELLRMLQVPCLVSPDWTQVRDAALRTVRQFERLMSQQLSSLWIVGEPRNPGLETACDRFAKLPYIDGATVKTHVVSAEQLFSSRRWKPGLTEMRCALEQVIDDAFRQLTTTQQGVNATNLVDKAEALGRFGAISRETARYAYGTYALLSELGSHPGDVQETEGERGWHAARVALGQLADRLS